VPDNELMSVDPGMSGGQGGPAPLPAQDVPLSGTGPIIDLVPQQPAPAAGVNPAAAVTAPPRAAPAAPPQEDQLTRALRLLDTDSSQLTQSDWNLIAADQLMKQNQAVAGRGGPTHSVKVGESQTFSTQRTKVGAEAKAADAGVVAAANARGQAVLDGAHAQQAELAARAATQEQQVNELAADNARKAEAEAQRQERMAKLEADQNRLAQDVAKEARSIDPDRWLHQSMGRTIGASLAAALGAYGATLGKSPNFALQIINDAIDRDFAGQKLKLQAKQDQQSMQARTIERTRALFGDQRAADMAARANLLEVHKAQVEALGSKFKGTQVEAQAKETVALIDQDAAKYRAQAAHLEDVHQSSSSSAQLATVDATGNAVGSGSGKGQVPLTAYEVSKLAAELKKKQDDAKFTGGEDPANSQRRTREVLDQFAAFNTMLNTSLPAWEKAVKKAQLVGAGPFSVDVPLSAAKQDKGQYQQLVTQDLVKALSGASSTPQEREQISKGIVFDPSASADRQIRSMHTFLGVNAAKMKSLYDSLTPDGKEQMLRAAGGNRKQLEMMLAGRPVNDWITRGAEAGGVPHEE